MPIMNLRRLGPGNIIHDYHIDQFVDALEGLVDAYDVAVADGYTGTRGEWLESLKGAPASGQMTIDEQVTASTLVDDFTDPAAWSLNNSGVLAQDTSDPLHPHAATIQTSTASPGTYTDAVRDVTLDLSGGFLGCWVKTDANFQRLSIRLSANGTGFSSRFEATVLTSSWIITDRWTFVSFPNAEFNRNGAPAPDGADIADIREISLEVFPNGGVSTTLTIADLRVYPNLYGPTVIFQFDDARADTYTTAYPILAADGHVGCIPVEFANIGNPDRCSLAQLQEMVAAGWEINAHHTGLDTVDAGTLKTQLRAARDWVLDTGFDPLGAQHFVYPGGVYNELVHDSALRVFKTARTAGKQTVETAGVALRGLLRPYYLTTGVTLASVTGAVDKVADSGGVLLIAAHSIVASPVAVEDWSIADFTALSAHVAASDVTVRLPSQVWP